MLFPVSTWETVQMPDKTFWSPPLRADQNNTSYEPRSVAISTQSESVYLLARWPSNLILSTGPKLVTVALLVMPRDRNQLKEKAHDMDHSYSRWDPACLWVKRSCRTHSVKNAWPAAMHRKCWQWCTVYAELPGASIRWKSRCQLKLLPKEVGRAGPGTEWPHANVSKIPNRDLLYMHFYISVCWWAFT